MKHGQGKYSWNDGEIYEGSWKEDSMHGEGKMIYANGDVYTGSFEDNRRHGEGEMVYKESGNVYKGNSMKTQINVFYHSPYYHYRTMV